MVASPDVIICKLKEVALAKGYDSPKSLSDAMKKAGLGLSHSTLYPYWYDKVKNFNRRTIEKLCEFLDVSPGLLIKHISEREAETVLKRRKR